MSDETEVVYVEKRSEWPQFLLLVIVALGVVVAIALLRPFIFNRVVPAILGPSVEETTISLPIIGSEGEEDAVDDPGAVEESDDEDAGQSDDTMAEDEALLEEETSEEEAVEETTDLQTHVVQPGQTLNQIARRYGVTVDALIDANKLANPDVLRIGQEIIIPNKE